MVGEPCVVHGSLHGNSWEENGPGRGCPTVMRAWARIAALIGAVLLLGLLPASKDVVGVIERGDDLAERLHYSAALEAYQTAAARCPACPAPRLRQAAVYMQQARYDDALHAYLDVARRGSLDGQVLEGLARLYSAQGSDQPAATALEALLRRRPGRGDLWFLLGAAREGMDDLAGARQAYQDALRAGHPSLEAADRQRVHARLGVLCLDGGEAACAEAHWQAAIEGPDAALGSEAIQVVAALAMVEDGSEPAFAWAKLGQALLGGDELSAARLAFERALSLAPTYADAHAYLGHVLSMLGEEQDAVAHLETAIALAPDHVLGYYFLGMHDVRKGWLVTGRSMLFEGHDAAPEDAAICAAVADTYLRAEEIDYAAAERWLYAAVDRAPDEIRFHLLLAHLYVDYNIDPGLRGVAVAEFALGLDPDNVEALETLGWAYYLSGTPRQALEPLLQARSLAPQNAQIYYRLGATYQALGDMELAHDAYQQAVDLDWGGMIGARARDALADAG
jgi:tetratricopeptide (TPR) repeat protein